MHALIAINRMMRSLCRPCARSSDEATECVWRYWVAQSNSSDLVDSDPLGSDRLLAAFDLQANDPTAGFAQFLELANSGSPWAMLNVGYAYDIGNGVETDQAQAETWYRKAWESGSEHAVLYLGGLYEGQDRPEDAEAAYRAAAEGGWAPAMTNLAKLIIRRRSSPEDRREAAYWLERAGESGDDLAPTFLAFTRMFGLHGATQIWPGLRAFCAAAERSSAALEPYQRPTG